MGQYNLDRIFKPRHVAVVGASEETGTICNALMKNLIEEGFSGTLLPVNPKYKAVHGHSSFGSVSDLEMGVDLAVIATPIHSVPDIVRECVGNRVGGAIVISAGGKEVGEKGREIEEKIRDTAYAGGLRVIGPYLLGRHPARREPQCQFCVGDARGRKSGLCFPERCNLHGDPRSGFQGTHRLQPFRQHRFHGGRRFRRHH